MSSNYMTFDMNSAVLGTDHRLHIPRNPTTALCGIALVETMEFVQDKLCSDCWRLFMEQAMKTTIESTGKGTKEQSCPPT